MRRGGQAVLTIVAPRRRHLAGAAVMAVPAHAPHDEPRGDGAREQHAAKRRGMRFDDSIDKDCISHGGRCRRRHPRGGGWLELRGLPPVMRVRVTGLGQGRIMGTLLLEWFLGRRRRRGLVFCVLRGASSCSSLGSRRAHAHAAAGAGAAAADRSGLLCEQTAARRRLCKVGGEEVVQLLVIVLGQIDRLLQNAILQDLQVWVVMADPLDDDIGEEVDAALFLEEALDLRQRIEPSRRARDHLARLLRVAERRRRREEEEEQARRDAHHHPTRA